MTCCIDKDKNSECCEKCCDDGQGNQFCCSKSGECCGDACCYSNSKCCGGVGNNLFEQQQCVSTSTVDAIIHYEDIFKVFVNARAHRVLNIYALAVGPGYCTIVICPNDDMLIVDMGSTGQEGLLPKDILALLNSYFDRYPKSKIHIVITHADQDHFNFFPEVFSGNIGTQLKDDHIASIILGGKRSDYTDKKFMNWMKTISADKVSDVNNGDPCYNNTECKVKGTVFPQFCGETSNVVFDAIAANRGTTTNQNSIVMKIAYDKTSILLTGDFEGPVQNEVVRKYKGTGMLKSTVYKIAHHGAKTLANTKAFLEAVDPDWAFVSQAYPKHSRYHHPRCEAISRLQEVMKDKRLVRTDLSPFVCWNSTANLPVEVSTYCYPMLATCRHPPNPPLSTCKNILITSDGKKMTIQYVPITNQLPRDVEYEEFEETEFDFYYENDDLEADELLKWGQAALSSLRMP